MHFNQRDEEENLAQYNFFLLLTVTAEITVNNNSKFLNERPWICSALLIIKFLCLELLLLYISHSVTIVE